MRILITSVGSNTSISIIKAIRKNEKKIIIIGTDINEKKLCAGAHLTDNFIKSPSVHLKEDYLQFMLNTIKDNNVDCVIPIHDLEIEAISEIKKIYLDITFWAVNSPEIIKLCNNKLKSAKHAEKLNIKIPKIFNSSNIKDVKLPLIVKPINGVSSRGIIIIKTKKELESITTHFKNSDFIIQEFIKGDEYTVDCYSSYEKKSFYGGVVRIRIETKAGISTKGKIVKNELLLKHCERFLNELNYVGSSNIQFIVKDNIPYFIEINPRFSGGGILSYNGNFNSPLYTLIEAAKDTLPKFNYDDINFGLTMCRYWEEVFYEN